MPRERRKDETMDYEKALTAAMKSLAVATFSLLTPSEVGVGNLSTDAVTEFSAAIDAARKKYEAACDEKGYGA